MPLDNYGLRLGDVYRKENEYRAANQAATLRDLQIRQAQRQELGNAGLRNLYSANTSIGPSGDPVVDYGAVARGVASGPMGEVTPEIIATGNKASEAAVKSGGDATEVIARIFGAVIPGDPNSVVQAKQIARRENVKEEIIAQIPDVLTQADLDQLNKSAIDPKSRATLAMNAKKGSTPNSSQLQDAIATVANGGQSGIPWVDALGQKGARTWMAERHPKTTMVTSISDTGEKVANFVPGRNLTEGGTIAIGKDWSADTKQLASDWNKSPMTRALPALEAMDNYLIKYPQGMPGIGLYKNIPKAAYFKTEEGQQIAAAAQWLYDSDLKTMSGGAVTDNEAERAKIRNALGAAQTAEQYRAVYKMLIKPLYFRTIEGLRGGYGKRAQEKFKENGGPDLELLQKNIESGEWGSQKNPNLPAGWSVRTR